MPTLRHTQQKIIQQLLIDLGLGTDPAPWIVSRDTGIAAGAAGEWPVFASSEPNVPENCITVYGTVGQDDGRTFPDREANKHDGIQVRVRGTDEDTAAYKIEQIRTAFEQVERETVTLTVGSTSYFYLVHCIVKIGQRISLGSDVPKSKRRIYTLNALTAIRTGSDTLLDGLEFAYRNNGTDHSGNGNDLIAIGSPGTTTGIDGTAGAGMLAGNGNYYDLGSDAPVAAGLPLTFSMWVKFSAGEVTGLQQPGFDLGGSPAFTLNSGTTNDSYFYVAQLNAVELEGTSYGDGSWHHIVGSYDGASVGKLYADGVLVAEESGLTAGFGTDLRVGEATAAASFQYLFGWQRQLSDGGVAVGEAAGTNSDIARLYAAGVGFDPTAA